jgi:hypothetical protein
MSFDVSDNGRAAEMVMDRLVLRLPVDDTRTGVVMLAGSLAVSVPERFDLVGFMFTINGQVTRTPGTQTLVTAAIGGDVRVLEGPLLATAGVPENAEDTDEFLTETDFMLSCHSIDFNPSSLGQPPYQPLPPIPIAVTMQARCRLPEEVVEMNISSIAVSMLLF